MGDGEMFGIGFGVGLLIGGIGALAALRYFERRYPIPGVVVDGRAPFVRRAPKKKKPKYIGDKAAWQKEQEQNDAGLG